METVFTLEEKITECKSQKEVILSEDERNNILLDGIIEVAKSINIINTCYLTLFDFMDELSACKIDDEVELESLRNISVGLSEFNTAISIEFSKASKEEVIAQGCKSALNDLRSNIRTLREYLEDTEERFLLEETEDLDSLIEELA